MKICIMSAHIIVLAALGSVMSLENISYFSGLMHIIVQGLSIFFQLLMTKIQELLNILMHFTKLHLDVLKLEKSIVI